MAMSEFRLQRSTLLKPSGSTFIYGVIADGVCLQMSTFLTVRALTDY
jgi:hypothetical protein